MQTPREQLGSFFIGGEYDLHSGETSETPLVYDARDLTTHAVCVGMTGSGKTGLCIDILEEAALDHVPALIVDPKGDITNLLLQFPEMRPEDFLPWINVDDARRKGQTVEEYAAATAENWRKGLDGWGIGAERLRELQQSADFTIYTPGSDAGIPISVLGSLAAPNIDFGVDGELARELITGTVAALLGLIGVKSDPIRDREGVLLANIFEHYWRAGEDLDLGKLILSIQNPPVKQLGVFDVDTYYPEKDRFALASALNSLVASPSFSAWLEGEPLDVGRLLFTADGEPRHSIFYLAHLSDAERMFFVTLLLENTLTWMRKQSGTTSLRALLYFDEVFGFFPPTAEPPSKRPLLTLMKQARAFGLGCILVTQNPVDVDYKGLANAGTWFIGKMQTERDKDRVLHGLQDAISNAGGKGGRTDFSALINRLDSRVFLMHNVHAEAPTVFYTRWAMSYLRGPLTRPQVRTLMEASGKRPRPTVAEASRPGAASVSETPVAAANPVPETEDEAVAAPSVPQGYSVMAPGLAPDVVQVYLPVAISDGAAVREVNARIGARATIKGMQLVYEAGVVGAANVSFVITKRNIEYRSERVYLARAGAAAIGIDWASAAELDVSMHDLQRTPDSVPEGQGPFFGVVPDSINTARELSSVGKRFSDHIYYNTRMPIAFNTRLDLYQRPDESEREYRLRLQQAARDALDAETAALKERFDKQITSAEDKKSREERSLATKQADYDARKQQEVIGTGESLINAALSLFKSKRISTVFFSKAATKRRMTSKAKAAVDEQEAKVTELQKQIEDLTAERDQQAEELQRTWADAMDDTVLEELSPRRSDVDVKLTALAWAPYWRVEYDEGYGVRSELVEAFAVRGADEDSSAN